MNLRERNYIRKYLRVVKHTTLNPNGPGVVRIHLIPPKEGDYNAASVVVLNGKDILPLNPAWAIMLSEAIDQINKYSGHEITVQDLRQVKKDTLSRVSKIYKKTDMHTLKDDLKEIFETLLAIAYGEEPKVGIPMMSIGEYAQHMAAPHRIDLMISSMTAGGRWHCNQKCINCYAAGQTQAEVSELSTDEWKKIIGKCREIGIPQITFTGGEPTMRNDLVELINEAQWFVTRLNTNGILLSKELCKRLYEVSLDSVQITLYSDDKQTHETLVGNTNGFEKTVQGIRNALEAGLNVSVNTPLCKLNQDYVSTLKFLHELGVEYVSCSGIIFTGNARNEGASRMQMDNDELLQSIKDAVKFVNENKMEIAFTSPGLLPNAELMALGIDVPTCGACMSNMAIAPNGDVMPCQSWLDSEHILGNILKDPWKRIWGSPTCMSIREFAAKMDETCPLRPHS